MPEAVRQWAGVPSIRGSRESTRMILLTFSLIGLQFCWGLETTYCTPYLLSLGLPKSQISFVWLAGPLSGLLMQPIVGVLADKSTSKYGRRRPFMIAGSIVVGFCMMLLSWAKECVTILGGTESFQRSATIFVAVGTIYVLDFAINVVQACCRSLIVDTLPTSQQQAGSAWATRVGSFASLLSFGTGTLDLVSIFPTWLGGDTQFKKVTLIAVLVLWFSVGVTSFSVRERILLRSPEQDESMLGILSTIWQRTLYLPVRVQAICWAQFWSSIGWFSFAFYSSTWVGETYYRYEHQPDPSKDGQDTLGNIGRLGSLSLVLFSVVTFASSVVLPHLVRERDTKVESMGRFRQGSPMSLLRPIQRVMRFISRLPRPDLVTAWLMAHLFFAFVLVWAPFVRSLSSATLLVALCGIPSTLTAWAPVAEMGIEINRMPSGKEGSGEREDFRAMLVNGDYRAVKSSMDDSDNDIELSVSTKSSFRRRSSGAPHVSRPDIDREDGSTGELAGIYLGVLNVYTTLPQFISTFINWMIFLIFEPSGKESSKVKSEQRLRLDTTGINAIGICFFVGAICALFAAEATRRLRRLS